MELNIDPEAINKMLVDAILKSALGKTLNESIDRVVTDLSKSYNNPFDQEIKNVIRVEMAKILQTTYKEQIAKKVKERVEAGITDEVLDRIIIKALEKVFSNY
ncbi:MAG: hypothetical protein ACYDBI_05885 [Thermoplasmataceae archaeon]